MNLTKATDVLRSYQKRSLRDVNRAFLKHRRVLLVEFMGTGKTVTAAAKIREVVGAGGRVLVLVHRGEILKQTLRKLLSAGIPAEMVGVIWSQHEEQNLGAPIQVASVLTLARRKLRLGDFQLVVVDEAHHIQAKSWGVIISRLPRKTKMLGLTATPERLDGKPLGEFFDEMVLGEPAEHLIEAEFLARPEIWTREDGWRPEKLRKAGSDYAQTEAARVMSGSTIVGGIPLAYEKHGRGLPAVLFAATTDQATVLRDAFLRAGVAAETLFGADSDKGRETKLERLRNGKTNVLCTCDVLGEGWDYDGCRVVILARPTASLARYMQWCGRAMRPGGPSIVLDHAGNFYQHGPPWEEREWSLDTTPRGTLKIAKVDREGRVSFLEPKEVDGKLVRADQIERQTICVGWDGPCPTQEKPGKHSFTQEARRRRRGDQWRCGNCIGRKLRADPAYVQRHRDRSLALARVPGYLTKMRERSLELWSDPEFRQKHLAGVQRSRVDPARRKLGAQKMSALWRDPEFRSKQKAAIKEGWANKERSHYWRVADEALVHVQTVRRAYGLQRPGLHMKKSTWLRIAKAAEKLGLPLPPEQTK